MEGVQISRHFKTDISCFDCGIYVTLFIHKTAIVHLEVMMTSSIGNIFRVTGPLCEEFTGHHKGQWRRALMFSLICARTNRWIKQFSWGWWFETPSRSSWRHCNGTDDDAPLHWSKHTTCPLWGCRTLRREIMARWSPVILSLFALNIISIRDSVAVI